MKKLLAGALAFSMACYGTPVFAEGLKHLPKWHMTGNEACYDIQGAKELVKFDTDLELCMQQREDASKQVTLLEAANLSLKTALEQERTSETALQGRDTELTKELKTCVEEKNKAEASQLPSLGWPVAGSVILVGVGILLGHFILK